MAYEYSIIRRLEHHSRISLIAAPDEIERAIAGMLFVDNGLENHVAAQLNAGFLQIGQGEERGHQASFHVGGAAPVHQAIFDDGAERIMPPLIARLDSYGVYVGVQDQRAATACAPEDADDVRPVTIGKDIDKATLHEGLVSRQLLIRQDEIVLPMSGILGDLRIAAEQPLYIGLGQGDFRPDGPQ